MPKASFLRVSAVGMQQPQLRRSWAMLGETDMDIERLKYITCSFHRSNGFGDDGSEKSERRS